MVLSLITMQETQGEADIQSVAYSPYDTCREAKLRPTKRTTQPKKHERTFQMPSSSPQEARSAPRYLLSRYKKVHFDFVICQAHSWSCPKRPQMQYPVANIKKYRSSHKPTSPLLYLKPTSSRSQSPRLHKEFKSTSQHPQSPQPTSQH